jgi:hypothetical protein
MNNKSVTEIDIRLGIRYRILHMMDRYLSDQSLDCTEIALQSRPYPHDLEDSLVDYVLAFTPESNV